MFVFLTAWMKRSHGEDELLLQPRHVDPAGVDVVTAQAGQLDPGVVVGKQVAISVLFTVLHCCRTQTLSNLSQC